MTKKKRVTWVLIASVVVAALIIGGVIAHSVTKTTQTSKNASKHPFTAATNASQPLVATITSIVLNQTNSTTFQSDGNGNYTYTMSNAGKPMTTVYTPGSYYICNDTAQPCIKYPDDPTVNNFDPTGYTYNSAEINKLKATTKYSGQQKCPDGKSTCDVWYSTTQYNTSTYYYVDMASKQIVQTIHYGRFSEAEDSTKVTIKSTYAYKNVHINVPTNYTDAPKSQ